jgi:hypothetical protein
LKELKNNISYGISRMDLLKYRDKIEGKKKVEAYIAKMKK